MLGLTKGTVALCEHDPEWAENAREAIVVLSFVFGGIAVDIQHTGSTAIKSIKAKPIIDIVVGVSDFAAARALLPALAAADVIHRPSNDLSDYMMFVMGDIERRFITHHIHVVPHNGEEWGNQMNFRDFLNSNPSKAKEYEALKIALWHSHRDNRELYTDGKQSFFDSAFVEAAEWRRSEFVDV